MSRMLRVLVVDDSAFVRKVVTQMLTRSPFIEVVGMARDGEDALQQVERLRPDVITLDLVMPGMGGVAFLREQMKRRPIPVVVCSITHESGAVALEALEAGAVEFVQKPTALATDRIFEISDELISKVKTAATVRFAPNAESREHRESRRARRRLGCRHHATDPRRRSSSSASRPAGRRPFAR
jgi:two-component system, chemotaxis family, protein-glutamate methylesterase/glutaminase